ncbi:MAG: insulinase family protein, partial [Alphaproteobacteria bacterium]
AREREVVLQEIAEIEDMPEELVHDRLQTVAFPDQPLGRPILGSRTSVRRFDAAMLRQFMARGYGMAGAVLSIAGRVDPERLLACIEALFSPLAAGAAPRGEAARWGGGTDLATRACEQAHCVLALPGPGVRDADFYAFQIHATLLGGGMSSRLFQEIREQRGLVYSVHAHGAAWSDTGMLTMAAGAPVEAVPEVLRVMLDQARRSLREADGDEIARARAQLKAGMLMARESLAARVEQMARQWLYHGRVIPVAETVSRLEAVDARGLHRLAERTAATPARPALAIVGPETVARMPLPDDLCAPGPA